MKRKGASLVKVVACMAAALFFIPGIAHAGSKERIIVRYDDGTAKAIVSGMSGVSSIHSASVKGMHLHASSAKRSVSGRFEVIPVTLDREADREMVLRALGKARGVKHVEFDAPVYACADPHVQYQYHMAKVEAAQAWSALGNRGNPDFVVAVVDTGIDIDHPDLADALWVNANEIPDNNIDDDGNGLTDDINGWNFYSGNNNVDDDNGHGTHVSGIIAARENGVGITGIAPGTKVLSFKVLNANGIGSLGDTVLILDVIREYKTREQNPADIRAVNMSFTSGSFSRSCQELITELGGLGIAVFAAAGNDTQDNDLMPAFPANCEADNLLSVGSLQSDNTRSAFSNYGQASVNVYAYGGDIYSTYMGGGYATLSGTSMAAPLALGCFLLGWSSDPSMNVYEALTKFHAGLEPTECAPLGRAHARKAVVTALPVRSAYKFREHAAMFSIPSEYGQAGINSTMIGTGLSTGTFTVDDLPLWKGESGDNYQKVSSRAYRRKGDLYWDVRVNGGKPIKRMLIKTPVDAVSMPGLPLDRTLVNDWIHARKGNVLYFVTSNIPREAIGMGSLYFSLYNMENETYEDFLVPRFSGGNFDINYSKYMFAKGDYIYLQTNLPGHILRFDTRRKTVEWHPVRNMEKLGIMAAFAHGDGKVWYAGGEDREYRSTIGEFDPETGEVTVLWNLPAGRIYPSLAYRNGKLYIAGGQESLFSLASDAYVIDVNSGESVSKPLPFAANHGQLVFAENRVYYLLGKSMASEGSVKGDQYLAAYANLTESGWIGNWHIHPEFIFPKVNNTSGSAFFLNVEGTPLEEADNKFLYVYSYSPGAAWQTGGYYAPAGTLEPDPQPEPEPGPEPEPEPEPTPPSGGGGGCSAAGGSPMLLMLLVPALLFARGRK